MKIRWTKKSLRLRLDDLEVAALGRGEALSEALNWPELGWAVGLRRGEGQSLSVQGATLNITLSHQDLAALETEDGLKLASPVRISIEKDYLPEHTR